VNSKESEFERIARLSKTSLPVPIVTPRLELRPFVDTDADSIIRLLSNSVATHFIGGNVSAESSAKLVSRMGEAFRTRGWGTLAVVPKDRSACIGYCGVRPLALTADVEIAFALDPSCWNLGYATEAARACIDANFITLGLSSIVATVYPDNTASCRVLTKLGLAPAGRVFGIWPREHALLFRIDRSAWEAGRADSN
jgi:[ribosomal protein S5]-alanine N-acetyltransferase